MDVLYGMLTVQVCSEIYATNIDVESPSGDTGFVCSNVSPFFFSFSLDLLDWR
jgi:hypothetical protein